MKLLNSVLALLVTVIAMERAANVLASIAAMAQSNDVPAVHDEVVQTLRAAAIEMVAVASTE